MKVLITGCAGFIGFHLTKEFIKKRIYVCGIDNLNRYYDVNLKKNRLKLLKYNNKKLFNFYKIDIKNNEKLEKIFKKEKFDIVINLAAQAGVRYSIKNPRAYVNSNLIGFFNVLHNVKKFKIKHFLFASTSSVYGIQKKMPIDENYSITKPIQFYAATKGSNELMSYSYSHLFKIKTSALRFFTVYGPWGRPDMALFKFTKNILNKKPINIFNYGKHERDFTYVKDCVKAVVLIALSKKKRNKYEVFNIANGKSEKLEKYIAIIEKGLRLKAIKKFLPLQDGDIKKTFAKTYKIKKFVKFKSKTNINEGIAQFIKWYKDYYKI